MMRVKKESWVGILIVTFLFTSAPFLFAGGSFNFDGDVKVNLIPEQKQTVDLSDPSRDPTMHQTGNILATLSLTGISATTSGSAIGTIEMVGSGGGVFGQEHTLDLPNYVYKGRQVQQTNIQIDQKINMRL